MVSINSLSMSAKSLAKTGLFVLTIAFLLHWGFGNWVKSIWFMPVNMPVSLPVGHVQSTEFETNLSADYWVAFDADYEISYRTEQPCSAGAWKDVHWSLFRISSDAAEERLLWATNRNPAEDGFVRGFHGPRGKYRLEWDIPPEAACLNSGHPRLAISTPSDAYEAAESVLSFLFLFCGGAGGMLILRGISALLRERFARPQALRMLPELSVRQLLRLRRHRPVAPIASLPHFPLIIWFVLFAPMVAVALAEGSRTGRGFLVSFERPGSAVQDGSSWRETLSVYEDDQAKYYVNGQSVELSQLSEKLQQELGKRAVWIVYFEAGDSIRFADAANVMNTIRELGAKVIWITPQARRELSFQPSKRD